MPRQRRVFEWCAGPGFIGFCSAMASPRRFAWRTSIPRQSPPVIARFVTDLADRVTIHLSDNLAAIPPSERFDLTSSAIRRTADRSNVSSAAIAAPTIQVGVFIAISSTTSDAF
jgi:hypothetical protein